jgi:CHAD domain-containing protein
MSVLTHDQFGPPAPDTRAAGPVTLGEPVRSRPSDPAVHQLRAALDTRLRALLAHDPGTRTGEDPEDLHQMRVAVRRMRATLTAARPLLDRIWADDLAAASGRKPVRKLVESTVALQDVLGEHQDACVAFVAGRLVEREELSRIATRQVWPSVWQQVQRQARSLPAAA